MLGYDFPLLSVFFTLLMIAALVVVVWFILWCLIDNFRRQDHGGWAKAGWTILVLLLPIVGSLIYVIARSAEGTTSAAYSQGYPDGASDGNAGRPVSSGRPASR